MTREERRAELLEMLKYRRKAGSSGEQAFITRFLEPLKVQIDPKGNLIKVIKNPDKSAPVIMWSSHTDTVHHTDGMQEVITSDDYAYVDDKGREPLGADCTTGVWLMMQMIRAKIPGLYIFHREEEIGGVGSRWIAKNNPDLVKDIKFAIAFDRMDTNSIITRQRGSTCCSAEFADSLNTALGGSFKHDPGGSFTDTASYTELIPECTNISVGYKRQHTSSEYQDLIFSDWLCETLLDADFTNLVAKRDPTAKETYNYGHYFNRGRNWDENTRWDYTQQKWVTKEKEKQTNIIATTHDKTGRNSSRFDQLYDLCLEHPSEVAAILDSLYVTPAEILEEVYGKLAA